MKKASFSVVGVAFGLLFSAASVFADATGNYAVTNQAGKKVDFVLEFGTFESRVSGVIGGHSTATGSIAIQTATNYPITLFVYDKTLQESFTCNASVLVPVGVSSPTVTAVGTVTREKGKAVCQLNAALQ